MIANKIFTNFLAKCIGDPTIIFNGNHDELTVDQVKDYGDEKVIRLVGAELYYDWADMFIRRNNRKIYRIVHFVRDPYEMILSSYEYLSQDPPPFQWERLRNIHPCETKIGALSSISLHAYARIFRDVLGLSVETIFTILHQARLECNNIYMKLVSNSSITGNNSLPLGYDQLLRAAATPDGDKFEGVRLEAARQLFDGFFGDILRMAANLKYQMEAPSSLSRVFFLDDFPVGDRFKYRYSATRLFEFLMQPHPFDVTSNHTHERQFFECMSISSAVELAERASYMDKVVVDPNVTNPRFSQMDKTERESYTERLRHDPIIGAALNLTMIILERARSMKSIHPVT